MEPELKLVPIADPCTSLEITAVAEAGDGTNDPQGPFIIYKIPSKSFQLYIATNTLSTKNLIILKVLENDESPLRKLSPVRNNPARVSRSSRVGGGGRQHSQQHGGIDIKNTIRANMDEERDTDPDTRIGWRPRHFIQCNKITNISAGTQDNAGKTTLLYRLKVRLLAAS